jgi:hypothetical protein
MRALTASEQIQVWELGGRRPLARRALYLLAASTGISLDRLAHFSLGRRDTLLLKLRGMMFGPRIEAVSTCPECRDELEWAFDVAELVTEDAAAETALVTAGAAGDVSVASSHLLRFDDYEVRFRVPNSGDLEAVAVCENGDAARELLLARCISKVKFDGNGARDESGVTCEGDPGNVRLSAEAVKALVKKMTEIDPYANVRLNLTCPSCLHDWSTIFDIVSFLWAEIEDQAKRLMDEVHLLASAYGWSEQEVLELSRQRRRWYVERLENA